MKTDFVASRPHMAQIRSARPGTAEVVAFTAKAFCVSFTVLFMLIKIYEIAKHSI